MVTNIVDNCEWQKIKWDEKVQICQRGLAHEDSHLITYILIFLGLETLFLIAVFNGGLTSSLKIVFVALGILVAIRSVCTLKKAGDGIDRWGTILHDLWKELNEQKLCESGVRASDFVKTHHPSVDKWKRREGVKGWLEILFLWWDNKCINSKSNCRMIRWLKIGWCNISAIVGSRRRVMTTCTPLLIIAAWAFILCQILDS